MTRPDAARSATATNGSIKRAHVKFAKAMAFRNANPNASHTEFMAYMKSK